MSNSLTNPPKKEFKESRLKLKSCWFESKRFNMWEVLIFSPKRSSNKTMCAPKGETKGLETSPTDKEKATFSYSGTKDPLKV